VDAENHPVDFQNLERGFALFSPATQIILLLTKVGNKIEVKGITGAWKKEEMNEVIRWLNLIPINKRRKGEI
jgi:hypothetical protein